jgi:hypothetical protein
MALLIVLPLMMIFAGVGLMQMKSWGRSLSIVYALLSISSTVANYAITITIVQPAAQAVVQKMAVQQDVEVPPQQNRFDMGLGAVGPFINMIYPIIVLIVMLLPTTGAAFSGGGSRGGDDFDRRRDDYTDPADGNGGGWAER